MDIGSLGLVTTPAGFAAAFLVALGLAGHAIRVPVRTGRRAKAHRPVQVETMPKRGADGPR